MSEGKKTAAEIGILERNKSEYFLKNNFHKRKVSDGGLVMVEVYNPNTFTVRMIRQKGYVDESLTIEKYILMSGGDLGPNVVEIRPNCFALLLHNYYYADGVGLPKGEPINLIVNMGNQMGVGNRLPSRPD